MHTTAGRIATSFSKISDTRCISFQEGERQFTRGFLLPKIIPSTLIKVLTKTKIYHVIFRRFLKLCNMSLSRFLDSISDDKHFKSVVSYVFGDLGR